MTVPGARPDPPAAPTGREEELLHRAYTAYDRQDVESLLALLDDDVDWPDGPGRLNGKPAVPAYWTEQWTRTRTHDEPVSVERRPDGRVAVRVDQVVRTPGGTVVSTASFRHLHRIRHCRLVRMDIEEGGA